MKPKWNKTALGLAGVFVAVALLWDEPVITPLKILVVFFHEISHGLAAVLTGGEIDKLTFSSNQGGLAFTKGGIFFIIVNAGYLGSFLWGAGLILLSVWTRKDRLILGSLGAALGLITVLYVRNGFGIAFGLASAAGFLAAAKWLGDAVSDFILKSVGVTSCGYALLDIWSDVISRSCMSDATILAGRTGIPAVFWGGLWILLTLFGMFYTFKLAALADPRERD